MIVQLTSKRQNQLCALVKRNYQQKQAVVITTFFRRCFCIRRAVQETMSDSDENVYELENGHVSQDDGSYQDDTSSVSGKQTKQCGCLM